MSMLQTLLKELQINIAALEVSLSATGDGALPHIFEAEPYALLDDESKTPPWGAFECIDKIRLDLKAIEAAVTPTSKAYLQTVFLPAKSSALSTAAVVGVTDAIIDLGGKASLTELAVRVHLNEQKLGRILRLLAGDFIYREVSPGVFANTRHSMGLKRDTKAYHFLRLTAAEGGMANSGICANLVDPTTRDSYKPEDAPFCKTVSKDGKPFNEYLMLPENSNLMESITEGVVPWLNKTTRAALLEDYPWGELGNARVIDVGCGPADSGFDILEQNPNLTWVLQDLAPMVDMVKTLVPSSLAHRVTSGDITFQVQDYFQPNQARGDAWYLRGIIREYDDEDAILILKNIAAAMKETKGSRMIINEVFCSSPTVMGDSDLSEAPSKFTPKNQSSLYEVANLITWNTFALFGGKERSYPETVELIEAAGLRVTKLYKFRTFTSNIECVVQQ